MVDPSIRTKVPESMLAGLSHMTAAVKRRVVDVLTRSINAIFS